MIKKYRAASKPRLLHGVVCIVMWSVLLACHKSQPKQEKIAQLDIAQVEQLVSLPLSCIQTEYPNKLGQTLGSTADLATPKTLRPAFYGCFDWHSAVHAHWSLVKMLQLFPEQKNAVEIKNKLKQNLTQENIQTELAFFKDKNNKIFERTYGWAWLLKLAAELHTWKDPEAQKMATALHPLEQHIAQAYIDFLPKLAYPIRTGDHPNTAFGLSLAYDYATLVGNDSLKNSISTHARRFYINDKQCPIAWEPSGYDFLSPCLEEIGLMQRILPKNEFEKWLNQFMPEILHDDFSLSPGIVNDQSDGTLVHLDGLNFSRAWNLKKLAGAYPEKIHLHNLAAKHINYSLKNLSSQHYEGSHWLGTFALHALE